MSDIDQLEKAFAPTGPPPPKSAPTTPRAVAAVTADYERRLKRLGRDKWHTILASPGAHRFASASEADAALIYRMVKCHFTDGEIWQTLEASPRLADRIERKGEKHARELYAKEIADAVRDVAPFADDPTPIAARLKTVPQTKPQERPAKKAEPYRSATSAQSFITQYVKYAASRTDAPQGAHELMAVGALSALAGPGPTLPVAPSLGGMSLVLWVMYVVNSTVGRKTTTISLAQDILEAVLGDAALIQWEGSPQGMIQRLQERDGMAAVFVRDEYSGLLSQMNRGGGHMAGLPQTFIRAWDGKVIENIRTRKRGKDGELQKDTDRVERPYLVKLTASTRDSLLQTASVQNVLDGFLARFTFITGGSVARPVSKITAAQLAQRDALAQHARDFYGKAQRTETVDLSEEVLEEAWQLETAWLKEANDSTRPDAAGPALKRLSEAVLKTAALIAIDETEAEPCVSVEHFRVARTMGERWKASTLSIIEELGATEFQRNCDDVAATVTKHPSGIQMAALYRAHRQLRKRDFDEIMDALEEQERIQKVQLNTTGQRGRPPAMVYPFGKAPGQPREARQ